MHVIFIAPHFPANQRNFVRALKAIGCRVTGIIDSPIQYVDPETKSYLDDYEEVQSVTSLEAVTRAVRKIQKSKFEIDLDTLRPFGWRRI